jgi:hypothetical protein
VKSTFHYLIVIGMLLAVAAGLQVWRDRGWQAYEPATPVIWLRAGPAMSRAALGFETLLADVYWIRAVVYFGRQGMSTDPHKNYDLLYPMLDLVTTLDHRFMAAYRFGAIFLSEPPPNGPGRSDHAVSLLERGVAASPDRWEYPHDLGFVYYWHNRDFERGAQWLERASEVPGAPIWLKSTAASMHSEDGNRAAARSLWQQLRDGSDAETLQKIADLRLAQFDAMDALDTLNDLIWTFRERTGRAPQDLRELVAARLLRGIPLDPAGVAFVIDPVTGAASVAETSALWPMPKGFTATPRR